MLQIGVKELADELVDGVPVGRFKRQGVRNARNLPPRLVEQAVIVNQHMLIGGDVLEWIQVVVQPQQMGLQRVEAVAPGEGLGNRPRVPDGPNETRLPVVFVEQHPSPKRP